MPEAVMIDFPPGFTADLYDQVDDRVNPPDGRPEGLQFHSAGPSPSGGWRVVDVWDSRDTFDRFLETKVMPVVTEILGAEALAQGEPPKIVDAPQPRARAASPGPGGARRRREPARRVRLRRVPTGRPIPTQ